MKKEERKKQIQKSIGLIGWLATSERIRKLTDRKIFNELLKENNRIEKSRDDEKLKKHGIEF